MSYTEAGPPQVKYPLVRCMMLGLGAGVCGVAAMTLSEKVEQVFTHRPNSYVPGKTLARLLGVSLHGKPDNMNLAMHWGQGIAAAALRGVMSCYGICGPFGSFIFMGFRLLLDQTLENWTGVGDLPWTWPANEQAIDLLHKGAFAFVTGYFCDRWIVGPAKNTM